MFLRDLWASCRRRWLLVLLCLALTGGAVYFASTVISPTYEAAARVVLVPPVSKELPDTNRYLGLGGLKQSADVVSQSMMSEEVADSIKAKVPGADYGVEPDWASSAPIIVITAEAPTSEATAEMLRTTLQQLPVTLRRLQASVNTAPRNQIAQVLVSRDTDPDPVQRVRIRILGVLGAGLLLLSGLIVAAADGLLLRRRERREAAVRSRPEEPEASRAPEPVASVAVPSRPTPVADPAPTDSPPPDTTSDEPATREPAAARPAAPARRRPPAPPKGVPTPGGSSVAPTNGHRNGSTTNGSTTNGSTKNGRRTDVPDDASALDDELDRSGTTGGPGPRSQG